MAARRAWYSIAPQAPRKFNELVPAGERSRLIESFMERTLAERGKSLEALAHDFVADGLDDLG